MNDRYLLQFLRTDKDPRGYWVTDCAFQQGQLPAAKEYVRRVLRCKAANTDNGLILDQAKGPGQVIFRALWCDGELTESSTKRLCPGALRAQRQEVRRVSIRD